MQTLFRTVLEPFDDADSFSAVVPFFSYKIFVELNFSFFSGFQVFFPCSFHSLQKERRTHLAVTMSRCSQRMRLLIPLLTVAILTVVTLSAQGVDAASVRVGEAYSVRRVPRTIIFSGETKTKVNVRVYHHHSYGGYTLMLNVDIDPRAGLKFTPGESYPASCDYYVCVDEVFYSCSYSSDYFCVTGKIIDPSINAKVRGGQNVQVTFDSKVSFKQYSIAGYTEIQDRSTTTDGKISLFFPSSSTSRLVDLQMCDAKVSPCPGNKIIGISDKFCLGPCSPSVTLSKNRITAGEEISINIKDEVAATVDLQLKYRDRDGKDVHKTYPEAKKPNALISFVDNNPPTYPSCTYYFCFNPSLSGSCAYRSSDFCFSSAVISPQSGAMVKSGTNVQVTFDTDLKFTRYSIAGETYRGSWTTLNKKVTLLFPDVSVSTQTLLMVCDDTSTTCSSSTAIGISKTFCLQDKDSRNCGEVPSPPPPVTYPEIISPTYGDVLILGRTFIVKWSGITNDRLFVNILSTHTGLRIEKNIFDVYYPDISHEWYWTPEETDFPASGTYRLIFCSDEQLIDGECAPGSAIATSYEFSIKSRSISASTSMFELSRMVSVVVVIAMFVTFML